MQTDYLLCKRVDEVDGHAKRDRSRNREQEIRQNVMTLNVGSVCIV